MLDKIHNDLIRFAHFNEYNENSSILFYHWKTSWNRI